ncbi:MAG: hypothetical protein MI922_08580 [Bacteroidales bacterium]|nr:hypothetical protein [Bacteroidales bacterium]
MKQILITLLFSFPMMLCFSQDTLVLNNKQEITGKVIGKSRNEVFYKKTNYLDGPDYAVSFIYLDKIKYGNAHPDFIVKRRGVKRYIPSFYTITGTSGLSSRFISSSSYNKMRLGLGHDGYFPILTGVNKKSVLSIVYTLDYHWFKYDFSSSGYGLYDDHYTPGGISGQMNAIRNLYGFQYKFGSSINNAWCFFQFSTGAALTLNSNDSPYKNDFSKYYDLAAGMDVRNFRFSFRYSFSKSELCGEQGPQFLFGYTFN